MKKTSLIIGGFGSIFGLLLSAFPARAAVALYNPLGSSASTPQALIGNIINAVLGVVGSLALLMFIYGGFVWLTSGGDSAKVKKGKDIFVWSTIGLVVIFASYGLVYFLVKSLK